MSGLEDAYGGSEAFRVFCRRFREEYPKAGDASFAQWLLEPTEVNNFSQHEAHEHFVAFVSSDWIWQDSFGDCSFAVDNSLSLHAANGRDLWHCNWSAPRLLQPLRGDFAVETLCAPASQAKPAIGGLLLWKDRANFLRLDRGTRGKHEISFRGCLGNKEVILGRGRLPSELMFLRLERLGGRVNALCSADGQDWFTVGHSVFPTADPVEAGVHAIGTIDRVVYPSAYPDGAAIRFELFRTWRAPRQLR